MEGYNLGLCYCNEKLPSQLGEESMHLYYFALAAALCNRWAMILWIKPDTVKLVVIEGGCHFKQSIFFYYFAWKLLVFKGQKKEALAIEDIRRQIYYQHK